MIIDSNNKKQKSILTNKCFYQTTARIMRDFEEKGYANSADETAKVIAAYHDIVRKKSKNNFNEDYNAAFKRIDGAIQSLANQVFTTVTRKVWTTLIIHLKNSIISVPSSPVKEPKKALFNYPPYVRLVCFCNNPVAK